MDLIHYGLIFWKKNRYATFFHYSNYLVPKTLCIKDTCLLIVLVLIEKISVENDRIQPFFSTLTYITFVVIVYFLNLKYTNEELTLRDWIRKIWIVIDYYLFKFIFHLVLNPYCIELKKSFNIINYISTGGWNIFYQFFLFLNEINAKKYHIGCFDWRWKITMIERLWWCEIFQCIRVDTSPENVKLKN